MYYLKVVVLLFPPSKLQVIFLRITIIANINGGISYLNCNFKILEHIEIVQFVTLITGIG